MKKFKLILIMSKIKNSKKTVNTLIIFCVVVFIISGLVIWRISSSKSNTVNTTSNEESAQNDYDGDDRHTDIGQSNPSTQGGVVQDENYSANASEEGVSSPSGELVLSLPQSGDLIKSGSVLRGSAKTSQQVQYRIIDESAGVIAQGSLKITNESFSGVMEISPQASAGRVEIFTYNEKYQEQNLIQIPVRFK